MKFDVNFTRVLVVQFNKTVTSLHLPPGAIRWELTPDYGSLIWSPDGELSLSTPWGCPCCNQLFGIYLLQFVIWYLFVAIRYFVFICCNPLFGIYLLQSVILYLFVAIRYFVFICCNPLFGIYLLQFVIWYLFVAIRNLVFICCNPLFCIYLLQFVIWYLFVAIRYFVFICCNPLFCIYLLQSVIWYLFGNFSSKLALRKRVVFEIYIFWGVD